MSQLDHLFAWCLVHLGLVYIVTESAIFSPVRILLSKGLGRNVLGRVLVSMLYCGGCCGFWLGILEGVLGLTVFPSPDDTAIWDVTPPWLLVQSWGPIVLTGLAGSGLGAWWAASRPGIDVMFSIEQQGAFRDQAQATEAAGEPVREPEASGGADGAGVDGRPADGRAELPAAPEAAERTAETRDDGPRR
jgi:hypothetical protein